MQQWSGIWLVLIFQAAEVTCLAISQWSRNNDLHSSMYIFTCMDWCSTKYNQTNHQSQHVVAVERKAVYMVMKSVVS